MPVREGHVFPGESICDAISICCMHARESQCLHRTNPSPLPYMQVRAFVCTDFTLVESSGESTLDTSHRPMHDATAELVQQIVQEQGFTLIY